jgi:hypothetical protein
VLQDEGDMTRQKKIEIALEAFLVIAVLISIFPLMSAVNKADHGTTEVPLNGAGTKN